MTAAGTVPARAAVVGDDGAVTVEPVEVERPRPDEVLVRVRACGICGTEIEGAALLAKPVVLGHEGAGEIAEVGADVAGLSPGDRVVISYPSCGACPGCRAGRPFHCDHHLSLAFDGARPDGTRPVRLGGMPITSAFFQQSSLATAAVVPARSVVPVPGDEPWEVLAALPCGVITGAGALLNALRPGPSDPVVVFGAGTVGLAAVMAARAADAGPVAVVDVNPARLRLAADLGAALTLDARDGEVARRLRASCPDGAVGALDTSGQVAAWQDALAAVARGGTLAIVTVPEEPDGAVLHALFEHAAILRTIYVGEAVPGELIPRLLAWRVEGRFPIDRLITTFPLERAGDALGAIRDGSAVKPVVMMD